MTISSLIPAGLKNFLMEIEGLGFTLCLVGGACRDYLMTKTLSFDLDFEMRKEEMKVLKDFLSTKKIPYSELPYQILRVDLEGYDLEFSLPRLERPIVDNKSHHHFEATLDPNLSYKEGFQRRDFTINAMGFELNLKRGLETFIDPYDGAKDLKNKNLKEISEDFFLDSVRFLRLIRFFIKYDFSIDPDLEKKLSRFDLSGLSKHHFISEMMKSKKAGEFIRQFCLLVKKHGLTTSHEFKFLEDVNFSFEESFDELLFSSFKEGRASDLVKFLSLPEKRLKDLESFSASFNAIKRLTKADLKKLVEIPLSDSSELETFKHLKNLEDKKEWRKFYQESLPISWSAWENLEVKKEELEALSPKLRSFYKYYQAVKNA